MVIISEIDVGVYYVWNFWKHAKKLVDPELYLNARFIGTHEDHRTIVKEFYKDIDDKFAHTVELVSVKLHYTDFDIRRVFNIPAVANDV